MPNLYVALYKQSQGKSDSPQPALRPFLNSLRWPAYQGVVIERSATIGLSGRWISAFRFRHVVVACNLYFRRRTHGGQITLGPRLVGGHVAFTRVSSLAAGDRCF